MLELVIIIQMLLVLLLSIKKSGTSVNVSLENYTLPRSSGDDHVEDDGPVAPMAQLPEDEDWWKNGERPPWE